MYTAKQFKETALKRGYANTWIIQLFLKNNPKDEYTEEDLIECYRFAEREEARDMRNNPDKKQHYSYGCTEDERKQRIRDTWF